MSIVQSFIFNIVEATPSGKCREVAYAVQGVDVDTAVKNFFELEMGEVIFEGPEVEAVWVGVSLDGGTDEKTEDADSEI